MFHDPLFIAIVIGCFVTATIVLTGIGVFVRGGEFNRRHGNRLMRWRIYAQAVSIALIVAFFVFRRLGA